MTLNHGLAGFDIQALHVALFANLNRCIHVSRDEVLTDHLAGFLACGTVWADGRTDHCPACPYYFSGHKADAQDIRIAVFLAESQAFRKMRTHHIAVKDCDLTPTLEQ